MSSKEGIGEDALLSSTFQRKMDNKRSTFGKTNRLNGEISSIPLIFQPPKIEGQQIKPKKNQLVESENEHVHELDQSSTSYDFNNVEENVTHIGSSNIEIEIKNDKGSIALQQYSSITEDISAMKEETYSSHDEPPIMKKEEFSLLDEISSMMEESSSVQDESISKIEESSSIKDETSTMLVDNYPLQEKFAYMLSAGFNKEDESSSMEDESSSAQDDYLMDTPLGKRRFTNLFDMFTSMLEESSSILEESSSIYEEWSRMPEDSSSMLEESSSMPEESSSILEESSFMPEESSPMLEESSSMLEESSSILEESSSMPEESSSMPEESSSILEESSSMPEESSSILEESSSILEESSSMPEESSSMLEESSSMLEESSSMLEESSSILEESSSMLEESSSMQDESSPLEDCYERELINEEHCDDDLQSLSEEYLLNDHLPIVKLPVLLASLKFDIEIFDTLELLWPIANVTKTEWSIQSLDCHVLLPSKSVFLKGVFIVDIEYVNNGLKQTLHTVKIPVLWNKTLTIEWLYPPVLPNKSQREFMFQSHNHNGYSTHHENNQQFADQIIHDLRCINFVSHEELGSEADSQKLHMQGRAMLSIDLLQPQYIDLKSTCLFL